MALETATYIHQLVSANPLGSDPIAFADDHIRLIKSTLLATLPNVKGPVTASHENLNNGTPVGLICMWSGGTVPAGWALCNGQTVAKADGSGNITTPDLRDRFIVGSGGTYTIGNTGGNAINYISVAQLPAHSHTAWTDVQGYHSHGGVTGWGGEHAHTYQTAPPASDGDSQGASSGASWLDLTRWVDYTTGVSGGHNHSIPGDGSHGHNVGIGNTGSGAAVENRPPYYALAFIMKV